MSLEIARQQVATDNAMSPVGSGAVTERQGSYRSESVKPTPDNSVLTKAAAEGAGVVTPPRTNLQDLARRVQERPVVTTASLYETLGEMPELDKTALPRMFEFIDTVAGLVGDDAGAGTDAAAEETEGQEVEGEGAGEQDQLEAGEGDQRVGTVGEREARRDGDAEEGERQFEDEIFQALGKLGKNADKSAAIAMARGYFEAKQVDPRLLNVLSAISAKFDDIAPELTLAQVMAAQEALLAAATLETNPAAVRARYRRKLREERNLGGLLEELAELGLEPSFPVLFAEIGADLAGVGRQSDRNYLRSLTAELKRLWQLKSALDETAELVRVTEPHISEPGRRLEPLGLAASLLHYCAKSIVGPREAQSLLDPLAGASLGSQVVFANALRDLHGRMPDGIWLAAKDRLLQYTALGALCHRLTEAEEQLYEAGNA